MDPGARNGLLNFESMQMTLLSLSLATILSNKFFGGKKLISNLDKRYRIDFVICVGNIRARNKYIVVLRKSSELETVFY